MKEKRRLPRHVDGRIRIGYFTLKSFFMWLPIGITIVYFIITNISPAMLFFGILLLGFSAFGFMELKYRETGLDYLISFCKYDLYGILSDFFPNRFPHKRIMLERSIDDVPLTRRFIQNQKVQEYLQQKKEIAKDQ
ncbi:hypothetical protein P9850_12290 [Anoxybacillus rupiensis]|uniref:Uncharacterized protein n=1 Tax=Anoxybacteroides rupiense TaxID=311460 RepID=A0ABD5IW79_9BACL|nr:hypothetical protein [Anoxybacillus rupiensis]